MKTKLLTLCACLTLAGCTDPQPGVLPDYTPAPSKTVNAQTTTDRFRVELVQVLQDSIAYDDKRGVYVITDTATGKEYLGVSGVGISELGSHNTGKTTTSDER